jgi:hypothetical protein
MTSDGKVSRRHHRRPSLRAERSNPSRRAKKETKEWIASSQELLAMTAKIAPHPPPSCPRMRGIQCAAASRLITGVSGNRDRGKPRGFAPPTPPYVRVAYTAVRRIKHGRCFTPCRRVRQRSPSQRLRSFRAARLGFTLSRSSKASDLDIRPHSRFEVSMSKRPSIVQAFSENSFRLLRLLLTSAPWSGRLTTTSVPT